MTTSAWSVAIFRSPSSFRLSNITLISCPCWRSARRSACHQFPWKRARSSCWQARYKVIDCPAETTIMAARYPATCQPASNAVLTSAKVAIDENALNIDSHLNLSSTLSTEVVVPPVVAKKSRRITSRNKMAPSGLSSSQMLSLGAATNSITKVMVASRRFSPNPSLTVASACGSLSSERKRLKYLTIVSRVCTPSNPVTSPTQPTTSTAMPYPSTPSRRATSGN